MRKHALACALTGILALGVAGCGDVKLPTNVVPTATQDEQTEATEQKAELDYLVLVNKDSVLPDGWEKSLEIVKFTNTEGWDVQVERKAYEAYLQLKGALKVEGVNVDLDSAYRSVEEQQRIWDDFTKEYGEDYTKSHVAVPGYSEHQTGLALDLFLIVNGEGIYENEQMMGYPDIWMKIHAKLADFGFILRYPEGKEDITGYSYEPWHIRYVGEDVAKEIVRSGQTFEEYLGKADAAATTEDSSATATDTATTTDATAAADYTVDYGTSKLYTEADIDAAIKVVMAEFGGWKGCTMQRIFFTDDKTCTDDLSYVNSLRDKKTTEFDEALVLKSDFHSPSKEEAEGTAWNPDSDYKDYEWHLGRTSGGEWQLLTWGY